MSMSFTQVCSCCGENKELTPANYYRSKEAVSGYHHECRACYVPKWLEKSKDVDWSNPFPAWVSVYATTKTKTFSKDTKKIKEAAKRLDDLLKGVKQCPCCGETKPLDSFPLNKTTVDKRASRCKSCLSEYSKQRYHAKKQDNTVKETDDNRGTDH